MSPFVLTIDVVTLRECFVLEFRSKVHILRRSWVLAILNFVYWIGISSNSIGQRCVISCSCWNSSIISIQPFVFSVRAHRMVAFWTNGTPPWLIMAFTSLTHLTAKFIKFSFPGFRVFQMTAGFHSNSYPKLRWFLSSCDLIDSDYDTSYFSYAVPLLHPFVRNL